MDGLAEKIYISLLNGDVNISRERAKELAELAMQLAGIFHRASTDKAYEECF